MIGNYLLLVKIFTNLLRDDKTIVSVSLKYMLRFLKTPYDYYTVKGEFHFTVKFFLFSVLPACYMF